MTLNQLLFWLAMLSGAGTLWRCLRKGWRRHRDWVAVGMITVLTTGLVAVLRLEIAGYVGAGVWVTLAIVPTLGARAVTLLTARDRFTAARWLARLVALLHPAAGWRTQPLLVRALELAAHGEHQAARDLVADLPQDADGSLQRLVTAQIYRLAGDWEGLRRWIEDRREAIDTPLLLLYLRALGETGDPEHLVTAFAACMDRLHNEGGSHMVDTAAMFVLAFRGRRDSLRHLLDRHLAMYPESVRQFWLGTAEQVATGHSQVFAELAARGERLDSYTRAGLQRRLAAPLPVVQGPLSPMSEHVIERLERNLDQVRRYGSNLLVHADRAWVTYALALLLVAVFAVEVYLGGSREEAVLVRLGSLAHSLVVGQGQWWRLFTANFLHYGYEHLLTNVLALILLGPFVEYALGAWRFLLVYLVCGVGAMAFVLALIHVGLLERQLLLGASGAVLGLAGATATILWRGWRRERARIASRRLVIIACILVAEAVVDLLTPHISFAAHAGGVIIGLLLGAILPLQLEAAPAPAETD